MKKGRKTAIYPGSFDPVTFGHIDIIKRAVEIFDKLYIAVASNPQKNPLFTIDERIDFIRKATKGIRDLAIESFDGLVVDYAKSKGASTIIRGLRATSDFDYEFQMALMNQKLDARIQTVFLIPSESHFYLSSTLIKEVARLRGRIDNFVPRYVAGILIERLG